MQKYIYGNITQWWTLFPGPLAVSVPAIPQQSINRSRSVIFHDVTLCLGLLMSIKIYLFWSIQQNKQGCVIIYGGRVKPSHGFSPHSIHSCHLDLKFSTTLNPYGLIISLHKSWPLSLSIFIFTYICKKWQVFEIERVRINGRNSERAWVWSKKGESLRWEGESLRPEGENLLVELARGQGCENCRWDRDNAGSRYQMTKTTRQFSSTTIIISTLLTLINRNTHHQGIINLTILLSW